MAANKKPRKAYRPRTVIANTLEMATLGSACVPQAVADSYLGPLRELVGQIKAGTEPFGEWTRLRDAALICEALMETGAADVPAHDRQAIVSDWLEAIESATLRRRKGPRDGLTAAERGQLDGMLMWYGALLAEATQQQLLSAQRHALRRVRAALGEINKQIAGRLPPCRFGRELSQIAQMEAGR
jgi:hypothetical protein